MNIKQILENPVLNLLARLIIAAVLLYAATGKIAEPSAFAKEIENYKMMYFPAINLMALILPWLELISAVLLIAGIRLKASSAITTFLFAIFIIAIISAMVRGLEIDCGCFAHSNVKVGWSKLLEDIGLLILSVYIFIYPVNKLSIERLFTKS